MEVFSDTTGDKYLYRYRGASHFSIDEIISNYVYMTSRDQLNDLNEFKWYMDKAEQFKLRQSTTNIKSTFIIDSIKKLPKDLKRAALSKFQEDCLIFLSLGQEEYEVFIDCECDKLLKLIEDKYELMLRSENSHRITCFSKKPLNATMMGHYGANKGIVIAYDVEELKKQFGDESLLTVDYLKKPYAFPLLKAFSNNEFDTETEIRKGISGRKYTDWEYEQEVRLVLKDNDALKVKSNQVGLLPTAIVGVCMAPNIVTQYERVLVHACNQHNIPVYKARASDYSYGFTAKLIKEHSLHKSNLFKNISQGGKELHSLIAGNKY
tara:strand:+ start:14981 stop:15946 length:966 start_codon:yes stop_codon:yes gene_type:complete